MARKATHALIQMLLPLVGFAQITLENEIALPVYSVITLTDGTKLLPSTPSTNSCVIYNVDFTPYRTLQFPTLPAEFDWFGPPTYITQSLFDTDESTIEYLLFGSAPDGTAMVVVGREDGSMVFSADHSCGRVSNPVPLPSSSTCSMNL